MIVFPDEWQKIGIKVSLRAIEDRLMTVLTELKCDCLSLSGGVDSSLLLYYMKQIFQDVKCYTLVSSIEQPDYIYSSKIVRHFGVDWKVYVSRPGDEGIRTFYTNLMHENVSDIITGDGIDEFAGGYYGHTQNPCELTYFQYIQQLQENHLKPLNVNSGKIAVYLPYLDKELLFLFLGIPTYEKFDKQNRKKIITKLAKGKIPKEIIKRRKIGFCDALKQSK